VSADERPDHLERADTEDVFVWATDTPDRGMSLMRPAVEIEGTLGTAASWPIAADVGGDKGVCCA
jgi:hypothetical protein